MQQVGEVATLTGQAFAESADGARHLEVGSPIYAQDVLVTSSGANIEVKFADDTVVSQGPDARLTVDEYVYEPGDPSASSMLLDMAKGTFRMVTGKIVEDNPDGMSVQSPLATIGIRGTGADFVIGPDGNEKYGIFDYHEMDLVITTGLGTRFITGPDVIVDVFSDGQIGVPRPYSPEERVFLESVAPITVVPGLYQAPDAPDDDGDAGDAGDEEGGDGGEDAGEDGDGAEEGDGGEDGEGEGEGGDEPEGEEGEEEFTDELAEGEPVEGEVPQGEQPPGEGVPEEGLGEELPVEGALEELTGEELLSDELILAEGPEGEFQGDLEGLPGQDGPLGDGPMGDLGPDASPTEFTAPSSALGSADPFAAGDAFDAARDILGDTGTAGGTGSSLFGGGDNSPDNPADDVFVVEAPVAPDTADDDDDVVDEIVDEVPDTLAPDDGGEAGDEGEDDGGDAGDGEIDEGDGTDESDDGDGTDETDETDEEQDTLDPGTSTGGGSSDVPANVIDTLNQIDGTSGDDSLTGTSEGDAVMGGAGNDTLDGGGGSDYIDAGSGDDEVHGGDGSDFIKSGDGSDLYYGDSPYDNFDWIAFDRPMTDSGYESGTDSMGAGVYVQLGDATVAGTGEGTASDEWGNTDTLIAIEGVIGGHFSDTLIGNASNNELIGLESADSLDGGAGNDFLDGGEGDDTLIGGSGMESGFDLISGGSGNDSILGGDETADPGNVTAGLRGTDIMPSSDLVRNFGGTDGFGENSLAQGDTVSQFVDLSSIFSGGITFGGQTYSGIYVNTNGTVSFGSSFTETQTTDISLVNTPMIAPFWAHIDTSGGASTGADLMSGNSEGTNLVWYDIDATNGVFTVTWDDVGYYSGMTDYANAFQLQIIERNDRNTGDYDVVIRYEDIGWVDDNDPLGETTAEENPARFGWTDGQGNFDEPPDSGVSDDIGDAETEGGNVGTSGFEYFQVVNGYFVKFGMTSDALFGGEGNDTIDGQGGNDEIGGDLGNDVLYGGTGNDVVDGGMGADTIEGNEGADSLYGGFDDDLIYGDTSMSTLAANDSIMGGDGNDTIYGNGGADTLYGDYGADSVAGEDGNDVLYGGDGDDTLSGGIGNDTIYAGEGLDFAEGMEGDDVLMGGTVADTLYGDDSGGSQSGADSIFGDGGDDSIYGGLGNDTLEGGDGLDTIIGGAGADSILGGAGNDSLEGGADADFVSGGVGMDTLDGGDGADNLEGGDDADRLIVTAGDDNLNGGLGEDVIDFVNSGAGVNMTLGTGGTGVFSYTDGVAYSNTYSDIEGVVGSAHGDTLTGNSDANKIEGMDGNDVLSGDGGDDVLNGGQGADVLTGGTGNDTFFYTEAAEGADSIVDFSNTGQDDVFQFDDTNFDSLAGFVSSAIGGYDGSNGTIGSSDASFIYDSTNSELWYDSNGDTAGGATMIATVSGDAVTAADIDVTSVMV